MNPNVKIALLWVGVILVGAYKLLFPWTPFWVDLSVIGIAVLVFLFSRSEQVRSGDEKKANDDLIDKDDL
ncbi:hypothetical protein ACO0LD_23385 [Undibacterium sp. Ji83W]|uniref:hypothetical protein n=1 Tax=Undibacterium sp. Ji83W TaxID=3413043 RepID=UPI003BF1C7CF